MLYNVYLVEGLEFLYIKTMGNEIQALLFAAKIGGLVIAEENTANSEYINALKRKATRQQDNYIDAAIDDYIDSLNRQQLNK